MRLIPETAIGEHETVDLITSSSITLKVVNNSQGVSTAQHTDDQIITVAAYADIGSIQIGKFDRVQLAFTTFIGVVNRVLSSALTEQISVVTLATVQLIVASAAVQGVVTHTTVEAVIPCAAEQHVIALATVQRIGSGIACQSVITGSAIDDVITCSRIDNIVAAGTR
ncbi:hypothetical protein ALP29_201004 [Pseudomonas syringae pv. avii]|uniref:Uncharacterized protein n=1 Tax=Pseudomonas syringae pv. avii TaxID=663959 RepID=A0A3M5UE83_PSESX|nr:hypothetical protein ALP29_201004 [Pseudomonas syringae pv. avii]